MVASRLEYQRSGKVRDLFTLPDRRLVLVASDRISAFDVVLPTEIPDKGRVLTGLSRFWFAETGELVPNHLLDTDVGVIDAALARDTAITGRRADDGIPIESLRGRVMVCQPTWVLPIEAVVRGYLAGSGWKEYRETGMVCGVSLPSGLREGDRLPDPIFTPATKAESGEHDENITFDEMVQLFVQQHRHEAIAERIAEAVREKAMLLFRFASAILEIHGILLADTKFEFGIARDDDVGRPVGPPSEWILPGPSVGHVPEVIDGFSVSDRILLIDEALTPDSSRFWDATAYRPGGPQSSFDKQYVRDWLEAQPWDKTAPGPALPDGVVEGTRARYVEAFERITGASFERYLQEDVIAP